MKGIMSGCQEEVVNVFGVTAKAAAPVAESGFIS